jgi:cGMP-dependent protein kinase
MNLGFAKVVVDKSYKFRRTPEYLAPEIIMSNGHNHAMDYWLFGFMLYELLVGCSPFKKLRSSDMDMFKRVVMVQYEFPAFVSNKGQDLVRKLLVQQMPDLLGMLSPDHYDVRDHPWFAESGCYYKKLLKKELTPPWLPQVKDPLDSSNFDDFSSDKREVD